MPVSMTTKREITQCTILRYRKASKKKKTETLNELCENFGWHRKHAIRTLNSGLASGTRKTRRVTTSRRKERRGRKPKYRDSEFTKALHLVWTVLDVPCGKRLTAGMKPTLDAIIRFGEAEVSDATYKRLLEVSASTCDRLLKDARRSPLLKGKSTTKPGTLLRHQIPVRTYADWDEERPGFLECDLVAHCGASSRGDYLNTLNMTDIHTGWTETLSVVNRAQVHVAAAIRHLLKQFPFAVLGIDSDNGSEFINSHLLRFCQKESITFTRSRPYKKNDSCYIESKNWHVVRRAIGYGRYEGAEAVELFNEVYDEMRLMRNYFEPSQKLLSKCRYGAKIKKSYDTAKTPCERVLACDTIDLEVKETLKKELESINPLQVRKGIIKKLEKLHSLSVRQ